MNSAPIVLVIDDDDSILEFMGMALSDEGYEVRIASDGVAALDLIQVGKIKPDLILLDVRMPVMSGDEFVSAYHRTAPPHAPIIAVTATRDGTSRSVTFRADGFLSKPFDLDDLLKIVARHARRNSVDVG